MTTTEDIMMSTDATPTGFYATVDGYAIPDIESGDTATPVLFATATAAEQAAVDVAADAANWYGLWDAVAAAVPAADYTAPTAPETEPLAAADLSALNVSFAPPVARISYKYAISGADGLLYTSSDDLALGRRYTVFTDREDAEQVLYQLRVEAAERGLRHARFDLVTSATVTTVTEWKTA